MNCYNCDTLLKDGWNYCPNCKRKIKKKKVNEDEFVACNEANKCHKCSCILNDKWNFCPVCGTSAEFYSDKPNVSLPTLATDTQNKLKVIPAVPVVKEESKEKGTVRDTSVQNDVKEEVDNQIHCPNCGAVVTEQHLFCASCGSPIKQNTQTNQVNVVNETKDNSYIIWVIVTIIATPLGFFLGESVSEHFFYIGYLISLFSIIYAKVKYPKNIWVKVIFWLFIILTIIAIICFAMLLAALILACGYCADGLRNMG